MENPFDHFGAAYLINLPERKDRLAAARTELARVGWSLGEGGVRLYAAQRFADRAGFPSASERGAFHSHTECLRDALRRGAPRVLLLEDDIAFASLLPGLMASIAAQLDGTDWDFCYLGHERTGEIGRAGARTTSVRLVPYRGDIIAVHMLLINGRVLPRLLAHLDRVAAGTEGDQEFGPMPVDGAYNIFRRNPDMRTLIADPKLGWQRPSRSDINPRAFDEWRVAQPVLSAARRFKHLVDRWRH